MLATAGFLSGMGPSGLRDRGSSPPVALIVAVLAVGFGVVTAVQPAAAAAGAAALVLAGLFASARSSTGPVDLGRARFRWVVFAWAYVMIRPIGHFTAGRTTLTAVGGAPSIENVLDLGTHAAIVGAALWSFRRHRFPMRPPWLLLALPALALLSAAWSLAPTVTLGFSFELIAIVLLAALTVAIGAADAELGQSLLRRTLRVLVQVVAVLCLIGLTFPHRGGAAVLVAANDTRFTWPGVHPLTATAEIGLALLIVGFAKRSEVGFSAPSRVVLLALLGTCLYLGQSRTAWAGLVGASLFGYWAISKGKDAIGRLAGAFALAVTAFLIVSSFSGALTQYLYRGESQRQVFALDGRLGLWTFSLHQLHTLGQWLFGYGLGGVRVLLAQFVLWAGDTHSAWLELLISLGLVGLVPGIVLVVTLAIRLFRELPGEGLPSRVFPILFVYVLVMSAAVSGFAAPGPEPGGGFGLLALAYVAIAFRERVRSPATVASHPPRLHHVSELRPAPI